MIEDKNNEVGFFEKKELIKEELTGTIKNSLSGFLRACVIGILIILQFTVIILLPFLLRQFTVYMYSGLEIFSIVIILSLVNDKRSASYKIAWICIVLVLPISGHIMYALWGNTDSKKKIDKKILAKIRHGLSFVEYDDEILKEYQEKYPQKSRIANYLVSEKFPIFKNNTIDYYPMGEDAFQVIFEELETAEKFILIDFFIVAEGAIWDKFHEILVRKIKQGVEVKFLYDDFGAMIRTDKYFKRDLEAEGFEIRVFNPIHRYTDKLYMNYRSHQKIIVIDGNVGFTGGFNIADEYANLIDRFGVWKDNGIRVVGDAVWGLTVTFLQMWEVSSKYEYLDYTKYKPSREFEKNNVFCQVIADGPANNPNNPIENAYKQMIHYANQYLYITTPYLIIEDDMKDSLINAVKSGIDVRIITPFIPDKKNVKCLTNYHYGHLLKNGVRIFEYTPGFIHAKTIINEECGIIGTINMDYRSFYLHYECGVVMSNQKIIDTIKADLDATIEQCHEYTYEEWKNRPLLQKIKQPILNLFSTMM
jgi:Phosphatidylserine/phosphatidylglycerophosphate/cardiolipin synthases and related enzymes